MEDEEASSSECGSGVVSMRDVEDEFLSENEEMDADVSQDANNSVNVVTLDSDDDGAGGGPEDGANSVGTSAEANQQPKTGTKKKSDV